MFFSNHPWPSFFRTPGIYSAVLTIVLGMFTALPTGFASSMEVYGFGARGMATVGAQTATTGDYHAVYYNPSRILGSNESKVGVGTQLFLYDIQVDRGVPSSPYETALPAANVGLHVGGSTPLGGFFNERVALGFLFYTPLAHGTRLEQADPRTPQAYMYQSLPDKMALSAAFAVQLTPWMQAGLGFQGFASVYGTGNASIFLEQNRVVKRSLGVDFTANAAITAGLSFKLSKTTSLGAGYRGAVGVPYELPIELKMVDLGNLDFVAKGTTLWDPHTIDLGVSHRLSRYSLLVSATVSYAMWSQAPAPNSIVEVVFEEYARNRVDGAAPLVSVKSEPVDLGAQDILIPRLGVEWAPSAPWRLCAGYAFRPTPLPRATKAASYLDASTHIVGLGSAYTVGSHDDPGTTPLTVDLALQWHRIVPRAATKEDPDNATGSLYYTGNALALALELHHTF